MSGGKTFPFVDPERLISAVVICHRNADADAYLSAFALSRLISSLSPRCSVDLACPEGMTILTAKLSKLYPHEVLDGPTGRDYDLYVAVDVGDTELLRGWAEKLRSAEGKRVLVDHHPLRSGDLYDELIVDEDATSAAEVVLSLFEKLGVTPDQQTAQALLTGIVFDSSHLAIAGPSGLRAAVRLMDLGADVAEARRVLRSDVDYGEVMAKLKGVRRIAIYKVGPWLVVTSGVGSYQAHVARALIPLGADVALVGGVTDGETRVSLRASQRFFEKTKLHLGTDVAEPTSKGLGGHGGGHATAASFACQAEEADAVAKTLARVAELLGAEPAEVD
jgi:nanoRNase/pAp phosphatase (c-di-AMP/oligoRNAs hydrolase)